MDFSLLKIQILRSFRGKRSQLWMSRQLGFKYNQYHKWESNRVRMSWKQFVACCKLSNIQLSDILFKRFMYKGEPDDTKALLGILLKNTIKKDIAKKLNCSPSLFSKLLHGQSMPSVEQVLQIVYSVSNRLFDFIKDITPKNEKYPQLILDELSQREKEQDYTLNNPYAPVIIRILETEEYENLEAHSSTYIANTLNLSVKQVDSYIKSLSDFGLIQKSNNSKYNPVNKSLNLSNHFSNYIEFKKFWLKEQIDMLSTIQSSGSYPESCYGGTMIMTVNDTSFEQIKNASFRYASEIMSIVHSDLNRGNHNKILCMHHHFTDILAVNKLEK